MTSGKQNSRPVSDSQGANGAITQGANFQRIFFNVGSKKKNNWVKDIKKREEIQKNREKWPKLLK